MTSKNFAALAALATVVAAHGNITSPPARTPGPAMAAACGQPAVDSALSDGTTPLEDIDMSAATASCQLSLCRGATFEDNRANVQTYSAGQTIRMLAQLPIPHEGPMNVSIVDTSTNTVIGEPLIEFASYADENLPALPANNTDFSVTMPQLADGQCAQAGQCTIQWFWFGTKAQQTYESCVDFVMASANASAMTSAATSATGSAVPAADASSGTASGFSFVYRARRFRV
ncbi:uncharacterized protein PV09_06689 [Verruconis gallopava]|uniref:Chitin-binding type-4 domain-containing protein n=1 Tax=Verruconis gallopava TaxID=253628 RepID=A0A0D2ARL3_9PEZI|nr:uncharacterized protein PV09_06689 [Verruconis gallopava]KIW01839.1 hypothetical protein PV09_06689 [Verruconis gallopava]